MLEYWIWLSLLHLQPRQKLALLQRFRDPETIYKAQAEDFGDLSVTAEAVADKDLTKARKILAQCAHKRIGIVAYGDSGYPKRLKNVEDPPFVLYYKGVLPNWEAAPVIGVVGTRKASPYGLNMAKQLGYQIAAAGALLVSGGALGIDAEAMTGALGAGQPTVAVLGCGVDVVYPKHNEALLAKTAEQGCLLSEYPPETQARTWQFPQRNRIISGISNGVLVVEAPENSGALITARYAMDQGRDVFVVPGNAGQKSAAGSNQLLRERVMPVFTGWDAVREYESLYPGVLTDRDSTYTQEAAPPICSELPHKKPETPKPDKKSVDNREESRYSVLNNAACPLTDEEQAIVSCLTPQPQLLDDVLERIPLPSGKALSLITVLALKGVVVNHPGKRISLK